MIEMIIGYAAGAGFAFATILFLVLIKRGSTKLVQEEARCEQLHEALTEMSRDLQIERERIIRLEVEKQAADHNNEAIIQERNKMEQLLIGKFENLSHKIFDEKSETFKKQSQESLGHLLSPLREKLQDFEKKVDDSFGAQAKEQFSLKEQIKNIVEANEKIQTQAEDLTKALKGDSKVQGDWGEVILEKILEDSGLRKDVDYTLQGSGMKLQNEVGRHQKPDVIVNLPENKHIIVDSKVSLTHYERYFSEQDETARNSHLKSFLASIKKHIKDLEERRYQDTDQLGTPDFVLMFIPIEAAYILAIQEEQDIQNLAWDKKVVLVCPTTLFATLKTVASVWRLEMQSKNVQEIAREGGLLYDKVEGFVTDMQALGRQMETTNKTFEKAMSKLSSGRGNILTKTERLKELGAKTSKSLPTELFEHEPIQVQKTHKDELPQKEKAA